MKFNKEADRVGHVFDKINKTQDHFEEIIQKLLEKTRLSHRKIAKLLGVNNNIVHKTNLRKK